MASITFQPVLFSMRDIFTSDFYNIPRFQRPYSWTSENLEDFWRDVVLDNDTGYFIGPMVAYRSGDTLGVVDGQQRITSITLALCAIRDLFDEHHAEALSRALDKYIEREDDDAQRHFVLRSEGAAEYLAAQFQQRPPRLTLKPKTDEQRALRKAYEDIAGWMRTQLADTPPAEEGQEESPLVSKLREIRDKF
jgi:uncharacterized protein with ParB-like and HNH nuclease domain